MRRLRDHRLVKLTGWTFDELGDAPAARCDWLLGVEDAVNAAQTNRERRAQRPADRSR